MSHKIGNTQNALYMKAFESYSILQLSDGERQIKTRPMKFFANKLLAIGWCKIHRSYMVNPLYITNLNEDRNGVCLQNGQILPISRRNKKKVLQWRGQNNH